MKVQAAILITMACGMAGCTPPLAAELDITSSAPPMGPLTGQTDTGDDRFCLHFRRFDRHYIVYGSSEMQSWITAGECGSQGSRRPVQKIEFSWRYERELPMTKQCNDSASCNFTVLHFFRDKPLTCSSAQAINRNQSAYGSTDLPICR